MNSELRHNIRARWIDSIFGLAHIEFQKRLWIEQSYTDHVGDFGDLIVEYFNMLSLEEGYSKLIVNGIVTQQEADLFKDFHEQLDSYTKRPDKLALKNKSILKDPEWIALTYLAMKNWESLKTVITNSEELEQMKALENNYLNRRS